MLKDMFVEPVVEIILFKAVDVVTASNGGDIDLPIDTF